MKTPDTGKIKMTKVQDSLTNYNTESESQPESGSEAKGSSELAWSSSVLGRC